MNKQVMLGGIGPITLKYEKTEPLFITIAGLIGVGKTTLAKAISKTMNLKLLKEPVEFNPYLDQFYRDLNNNVRPSNAATMMQFYLLNERVKQQTNVEGAIQDRSIYEDEIFCKLLKDSGHITALDYSTYQDTFKERLKGVTKPNFIIYLHISPEKALERIKQRKREVEKNITLEYITTLYNEYQEYIKKLSKVIPVIEVDYETYKTGEEMATLIEQEWKKISGIHQIKK